jgi:hypothetical protein
LVYVGIGAREDGARKKISRMGEETMSTWGSSASRGAREGAREQLEEKTVRASSLVRAGSWSKSSSLSSHLGSGEKGIWGDGGGDDFLRYFKGKVSVQLMAVCG